MILQNPSNDKKIYKIILADDDPDDCLFFRNALDEIGNNLHMREVNDGEQLTEALQVEIPDVIFLDLNMPRKKGLQCLREIRENRKYDCVTVIILTTSFDKQLAEVLHRSGAQHSIQKPSDFQELKLLVNCALHLVINKKPVWQKGFAGEMNLSNFHILPETVCL